MGNHLVVELGRKRLIFSFYSSQQCNKRSFRESVYREKNPEAWGRVDLQKVDIGF